MYRRYLDYCEQEGARADRRQRLRSGRSRL